MGSPMPPRKPYAELAPYIQDLKNRSGMTKAQIATAAEVSSTTVDNALSTKGVKWETYIAIVKALGGDQVEARSRWDKAYASKIDLDISDEHQKDSKISDAGQRGSGLSEGSAPRPRHPWSKRSVIATIVTLGGIVVAAVLFAIFLSRDDLVYGSWTVKITAGSCDPSAERNDAVRAVVDFDARDHVQVNGTPGVAAYGPAHDLTYYIYCQSGKPVMWFYYGMATGLTVNPTHEQCAAAIPAKPSILSIIPTSGMTICTKTDRNATVALHIDSLAPDGTSATFSAKLWS